jgi:hypothetical protein
MLITNIITGIVFIGVGFLVKLCPNLIAGYNTMSKEKKKNVDIKGLSTLMKRALILIGLIYILLPIIFHLIDLDEFISFCILFSLLILWAVVLLIKAQKFDENNKKRM